MLKILQEPICFFYKTDGFFCRFLLSGMGDTDFLYEIACDVMTL